MFKLTRLSLKYLIFVMWGLCVAVAPSVAVGEEAEFLKFGRSLDSEKSNVKSKEKAKYKKALAKFPNVQSCVVNTSGPEGLQNHPLDQSKIESLKELEVCLFRVSAILESVENTVNWLTNSGFKVSPPRSQSISVMSVYGRSKAGFQLSAGLPRKEIDMNFGWFALLGVYSLSFGVTFDSSEQPIDVHAGFTRE